MEKIITVHSSEMGIVFFQKQQQQHLALNILKIVCIERKVKPQYKQVIKPEAIFYCA